MRLDAYGFSRFDLAVQWRERISTVDHGPSASLQPEASTGLRLPDLLAD